MTTATRHGGLAFRRYTCCISRTTTERRARSRSSCWWPWFPCSFSTCDSFELWRQGDERCSNPQGIHRCPILARLARRKAFWGCAARSRDRSHRGLVRAHHRLAGELLPAVAAIATSGWWTGFASVPVSSTTHLVLEQATSAPASSTAHGSIRPRSSRSQSPRSPLCVRVDEVSRRDWIFFPWSDSSPCHFSDLHTVPKSRRVASHPITGQPGHTARAGRGSPHGLVALRHLPPRKLLPRPASDLSNQQRSTAAR